MNVIVKATSLYAYIERDPRMVRVYENYRSNTALIGKIREALPSAHVLAVSAY